MRILTAILFFLSLTAEAQSGRYKIDLIDTRPVEGYITITDTFIRIDEDSTTTILPVIDSGNHRSSTYYILEGCVDGTYIRGAGMWTDGHKSSLGNHHYRYHSSLYVELRAKQKYISTRYSLFYDK